MAWIETHQKLERHPKLMDLCIKTGWDKHQAIGKMVCLWWWALDFAEDGDLSKYQPEQFLSHLNGNIPSKDLYKILQDTNFIEKNGLIHDWLDYAGRYLTSKYRTSNPNKLKEIEKKYKSLKRHTLDGLKSDTLPNHTLPNQDKRTQPYWAAFSERTQEELKTISKEFNIYQFLGKLKKIKNTIIPEEVINKICTSYLKNKAGIKANWPWFLVTTRKEWESWNAEQQIKEGQEWKKVPVAPAIKQILAGMRFGDKQ